MPGIASQLSADRHPVACVDVAPHNHPVDPPLNRSQQLLCAGAQPPVRNATQKTSAHHQSVAPPSEVAVLGLKIGVVLEIPLVAKPLEARKVPLVAPPKREERNVSKRHAQWR